MTELVKCQDPGLPVARSELEMAAIAEAVLEYGRRDLELVHSIEELLDLRRKTAAIEDYITRAVRDRDHQLRAQNAICELRLRQERKIGEWLAQRERNGGGNPKLLQRATGSPSPASYRELGIERTQAHRFQLEARVPEEVFESHVEATKAAGKELSTSGLLDLAKRLQRDEESRAEDGKKAAGCTVADLKKLVRSGVKFGTIYADPPWPYRNQKTRAATGNHYNAMTLDEIAALPVADLAAERSHLHLWTTSAFLFEAQEIIRAWGFRYAGSSFVWVKDGPIGLGNYWRLSHELLLLAVRGNCPFRDRAQRSWQSFERGEHSEKPEEVRRTIERVSPAPRLELFARRAAKGWTAWGDEIDRDEFRPGR